MKSGIFPPTLQQPEIERGIRHPMLELDPRTTALVLVDGLAEPGDIQTRVPDGIATNMGQDIRRDK